jgi:CubicO group peptidase (beta-lactamase class C family)
MTMIVARRIRPLSLALVTLFNGAVGALATPGDIPEDVKEHIRKRVDQSGTVGIVVGVVGTAGPTFFSHGVAAKGGAKLDEDTVFEIGSVTKVFTAMLLADAIARGDMRLDDPITKYLPPAVKVPALGDKPITLEHLATHRSGLPGLPGNLSLANEANPYADYTVEQLYSFLGECTLTDEPGKTYHYSNLGAGLLGHVLAIHAGKSYDELVRARICQPLGMDHTACKLSPDMKKHLAQGHAAGEPVSNWDLDTLAGAGGLRSNARDMTAFLGACLGRSGDKLQPVLKKCLEPRYPTGLPATDVALGWHVNKKYDAEMVWHNGGTGGYHSFCGFRTDRQFAVVVLTNSDDDIDDIGMHVLEPQSPLKAVRPVLSLDAAVLDEFVGYFAFTPAIRLHVTRDGGVLRAQLTGQEAVPIFAEAKDQFFYKGVDAQLTFSRDADGKVAQVMLHQNDRDQTARKLSRDEEPKPRVEVKVGADVLKAYVGKYQLGPNAIFDVRLDGERLSAQLTGQPRFPLFAESETEFFYKVVDAQIMFVREADGKVAGLILHQGGVDQKAARQ